MESVRAAAGCGGCAAKAAHFSKSGRRNEYCRFCLAPPPSETPLPQGFQAA
jgi:hypothetical protein